MKRSKKGVFALKSVTPYNCEKEKTNELQQMDMSKALPAYSLKHHPVSENLSEGTQKFIE